MLRRVIPYLSLAALAACSAVGHGVSGNSVAAKLSCAAPITGTMPLYQDASFLPVVGVSFDGKAESPTLLDTGAWWGVVDPILAAGLQPHPMVGRTGVSVDGRIDNYVTFPHVAIGRLHSDKIDFLLANQSYDQGFHGTLGGNILKIFNVEIDPVEKTVRLHDQSSCADKIDWPHQDLTILPFELDAQNHIVVPAMLDGHRISAIIDTGAAASMLSNKAAIGDFKLQASSPKIVRNGEMVGAGGDLVASYEARLGSLQLGDIRIAAPRLNFFPESEQDSGMPDLIIGMHELHAMHLYIAFSERKLYLTSARGDIAARKAAGEDAAALHDPAEEIFLADIKQDEAEALAAHDVAAARDVLVRGIPTIPSAHVAALRATMHILLGEFDDALKDVDAAEAAGTSHAMAQSFRGWVAYDQGKFAAAREAFDSALTKDRTSAAEIRDPAAYYGRGLARAALGDADGSDDIATARSIAKNVDDTVALTVRPLSDGTIAAYAHLSQSAAASD